MDQSRRDRLTARLAALVLERLGERDSWSLQVREGLTLDGRPVSWMATAHRAGESRLILHESTVSRDGASTLVRHWNFLRGESGAWTLDGAEKNHAPLDDAWLNDELEEALGRLENPEGSSAALETPVGESGTAGYAVGAFSRWNRRLRLAAGLIAFVSAFFILLAVNSLQYHRVVRLVGKLDEAIDTSSREQSGAVMTLADRLEGVDTELDSLRDNVFMERQAFEFSRTNTAMTIRKQADDLPWSQSSRKRAYYYLADRIEAAGTYGEIIYQLSRLPEDNAQAETIMAVDRANIVPLSTYAPVVAGMVYPVRLDGESNDGSDFMISSGFGEMRPSALGSGGWRPHMAVDIINIRNILTVTTGNSIVRFPGEPGSVVAAADGEVLAVGHDDVFGWNIEIEHPITPVLRGHYEGIKRLTTFYAHMKEKSAWEPGQLVKANEKLGDIGETGQATGPHLHFEVRVYRDDGEYQGRFGSFDRVNPFVTGKSSP